MLPLDEYFTSKVPYKTKYQNTWIARGKERFNHEKTQPPDKLLSEQLRKVEPGLEVFVEPEE